MNHISTFFKYKTLFFFSLFLLLFTSSYGQSSEGISKIDTLSKPRHTKVILPKFRIGAQIGYGYRNEFIVASSYYSKQELLTVKPMSNSMKNHLLQLNNNLSYGVDFSYYIINNLGFGIRYNGINAWVSSSEVLFPFLKGSEMRCSVSEKIGIHYIGALIATRYFLTPNKHCFFANIGAGLSIYKNHFIINSQEFNLKDNTAAFVAEFGYDFFVTKNFAIGLQASLFFGSQKFFSFVNDKGIVSLGENVQQPNRLNMNHLDISIGFRFYK